MSDLARDAEISVVTRRKLATCFDHTRWSGDLDEPEFLARLYDLESLPTTDSRFNDAGEDVHIHRVVNPRDWDDDWVFFDERFELGSSDSALLRFLVETLHPEVRSEPDAVNALHQALNQHLSRDGWELHALKEISGYPVFAARRCIRGRTAIPEGFPLDPDQMMRTIAQLLQHRGQARELAVVANSEHSVAQQSYDNWNGGTIGWAIHLDVDATLYARLSAEDREACEACLRETGSELFRTYENDHLEVVALTPSAEESSTWREQSNRWLSGRGVSNQGRVRSDNIASLGCDGLLFRSEPEIHLYRALKRLGVTFAPLPVFVRGGDSYARLEPDFVILRDGCLMVVEVDGDTYHRESPADAHSRLLPLDHEGAKIERIKAEECDSPTKAQACAARLSTLLDRISRRR